MRKMNSAEVALLHMIRRVQSDASFAWVMIGTESLSLAIDALAECRNEPVERLRSRVEKNAATTRETPEVVKLRQRVEELERLQHFTAVEDRWHDPRNKNRAVVEAIEELVRLAECGGCEVLTVENLKTVLGRPSHVHTVR